MKYDIDIDDLKQTLYCIAMSLHESSAFVKRFRKDTVVKLTDYVFHHPSGTPS